MLRIEVENPADLSKPELRALATLFSTLAGDVKSTSVQTISIDLDGEKLKQTLRDAAKEFKSDIDPLDNPSAGVDAAEIFAGGANPVEVFAGNVPAAPLPTASEPANVAAPVPSIAPAPVPSGSTVELDSAGLPWDGRIHAASKARIQKDNTWKKRRGVDDCEVATVEAELRAVLAAPVPVGNVPPPPPPPTVVGAVTFMPAAPNTAPTSVPPPPPAPVAAVTPIPANPAPVSVPNVPPPPTLPVASHAVPVGVTPMTFPQLVPKVTLALANKTITEARLKQVLDHYSLPSIPSLVQRADLVPLVHDALFGTVA